MGAKQLGGAGDERANPGTTVELVGIETRGDVVLDISLQNLAQLSGGKEFFVAEIDQALRSGAVDLTVHSMKDLSLDRPVELILAANPERENPRDVALFGPGILGKLRAGQRFGSELLLRVGWKIFRPSCRKLYLSSEAQRRNWSLSIFEAT